MIVKITSKRQVTFPARVLDELGVGPGGQLVLEKGDEGYILKPRRIDLSKLGMLHDLIDPNVEPFDIRKFRDLRERGHGPAIRY